jgi:hypothetical protein
METESVSETSEVFKQLTRVSAREYFIQTDTNLLGVYGKCNSRNTDLGGLYGNRDVPDSKLFEVVYEKYNLTNTSLVRVYGNCHMPNAKMVQDTFKAQHINIKTYVGLRS